MTEPFPALADPGDSSMLWRAACLRCPYCGALILPEDLNAHSDAHRRHDKEHDE